MRPIYAVVVGVSVYYDSDNHPVYPYLAASDDSQIVVDALRSTCEIYKRPLAVTLINDATMNARPSRHQILKTVHSANQFNKGECDFLFFFSGHGSTKSQQDILHPCDYIKDLPIETGLTINQLIRLTNTVKGWRLFVSDGCRTLDIPKTQRKMESDSVVLTNSSTFVIRSCEFGRESIEDPELNETGAGIFSYHFARSLSDMAETESLLDLFFRTRDRVSSHTAAEFSVTQTPVILGGDSSIILPFRT